jgi:hypothetical protein
MLREIVEDKHRTNTSNWIGRRGNSQESTSLELVQAPVASNVSTTECVELSSARVIRHTGTLNDAAVRNVPFVSRTANHAARAS